MVKVFVSYSRDDEEFVRKLKSQLEAQGIDVWVDWQDIPAGFSWRQAIYDGILKSEFFIPCVSPSYIASEMCRMESYLAQAHNKPALPLMLHDSYQLEASYPETKHLHDMYHLDFTGKGLYSLSMSDEQRLANLLSVIKGEAETRNDNILYIAFPSAEYAYANQIWADLNAANLPSYISTMGYQVGDDWNKRHWQGVRRSRIFIPILTVAAASSFYMKKEVLLARTLNLPMLPILTLDASSNEGHLNNLRKGLDESFEMRLLSEIQWLQPLPSYESMLESLISIARNILSGNERS
jgi:hypothetical protein